MKGEVMVLADYRKASRELASGNQVNSKPGTRGYVDIDGKHWDVSDGVLVKVPWYVGLARKYIPGV